MRNEKEKRRLNIKQTGEEKVGAPEITKLYT
jgi:hypothetical protein